MPLTVYFDTSLYVELDRADDAQARRLAEALAGLNVRPIVSRVLVGELALNVVGGVTEQRLVDRIEALPEALPIEGASWEPLRLQGEERDQFREMVRAADRASAKAMSMGQAAARGTAAEQLAFATGIGMPTEAPAAMEFSRDMVRSVMATFKSLRATFGDPETDPTAAAMVAMLDQIATSMTPFLQGDTPDVDALQQMLRENPIIAQCVRGTAVEAFLAKDDRRVVAVGLGDESRIDDMANLRRDAAHIHVFLENLDQIDYLHVDKKRMGQIVNGAKHPVRVAGVEARCYVAPTIEEHILVLEAHSRNV